MLDEINAAIKEYNVKWQALVEARKNKEFFEAMKPTAIGWKVADREEYDRVFKVLHDKCGRVAETWMNERWIAKMILDGVELEGGICVIKLMQRRPGSDDTLGLDHVDFYAPDTDRYEEVFKGESHDLRIVEESNEAIDNYSWTSIWFDGTEAKIKPYTVLTTVADELKDIEKAMLAR
jgi:hypothetical protein